MNVLDEAVGGVRVVANPGHCRVLVVVGNTRRLLNSSEIFVLRHVLLGAQEMCSNEPQQHKLCEYLDE